MFKTDGSVHHSGIKNETNTIKILNELKIYSNLVEKRGGTKNKEDAVAGDKSITIKKKEGIVNGSFDWFNSSRYNDVLNDSFDSFLSSVKEFRSLPQVILQDVDFIDKVRNKFNELCEECLNNLSSQQVIEIIQRGLCDANVGFDVVINDVKTNHLYMFPFENHPAVSYIKSGYSISLQGSGKSSKKIIFSDGINDYDCGLRIRVTSNNGIKAFLGLSKANKNSQVVIKLQQDKVKTLIESTEHKRYDY